MKTAAFILQGQLSVCDMWSKRVTDAIARANHFSVDTIALDELPTDISFTFGTSSASSFIVKEIEFPVSINPSDDGFDVSAGYDVRILIDGTTTHISATLNDNYMNHANRASAVNVPTQLSISVRNSANVMDTLHALFTQLQAAFPLPARITEKLLA